MVLESTVGVAKVGTNSLRATIPEGIVDFLGVREGNKLLWKMEMQDDRRFAVVKKKEESEPLHDEIDAWLKDEKEKRKLKQKVTKK